MTQFDQQEKQTLDGLHLEYTTYARQRCFVGHTRAVEWREDLLSACNEMLAQFGLEPWYAEKHFDPSQTLREKVVHAIANARYGIYDLSQWRNEQGVWKIPRNVLIELGMAIALNRPTLLLRHSSNSSLPLPTCLQGVEILEFSGAITLKRTLRECLPQWLSVPPDRDWMNHFCIFGQRQCVFREAHPRTRQWGRATLRCHVADGLDRHHPGFHPADRDEVRGAFEGIFHRYSDLSFDYLDELSPAKGYLFALCGHCQAVRSSPFAVYRIAEHTPAEVFITIGMSIALETIFAYQIPKILMVHKEEELPALLRGYEVVEVATSGEIERKLRTFIPMVMQQVRETSWRPRPLPHTEIPLISTSSLRMPLDIEPYQSRGEGSLVSGLIAPGEILHGQRDIYQALGLIGRGGGTAVYRVQRQSDRSVWALKELALSPNVVSDEIDDYRKFFIQMAELLASLSHPNLPTVADLFAQQGRPMLVLEFIPGMTLEDRLRETNAPLLKQQVISYGVQIAQLLHYLHTCQPSIIYRDMKPSNVMLRSDGVVKVVDLDALWIFQPFRRFKPGKTRETVWMGTPGYAPPEQYGKGQADTRSDIFALGATLLHLLTNIGPTPLQVPQAGAILRINPSVDTQLEGVIIKAMQLDPAARYQTMAELEQGLLACQGPISRSPTAITYTPTLKDTHPVTSDKTIIGRLPPLTPSVAQQIAQSPAPKLSDAQCSRCGRINKLSARYCASCGTPILVRLLITSPRGSWEQTLDRLPLRIGRRDPQQNHYPEIDLGDHDRGIASRNHAVINRDSDSYTLTDLGSTNGTQLNGTLIPHNQLQRLHSGDRIQIGDVEIEFCYA